MNTLLLALLLTQLPLGESHMSEVSTNIPLVVDTSKLETLRFGMTFASCATNEIAIAVGCDADCDGDLSLEEAAFVFGCDCGSWYLADLETGDVSTNTTGVLNIPHENFRPEWNLVKVLKRGCGDMGESVALEIINKRLILLVR